MGLLHAYAPIDLDPCADEHSRTCATNIFTEHDNSLERSWAADVVFVNPPGKRGLPKLFYDKAEAEVFSGTAGTVLFLCYSLEQLQQFQPNWPVCIFDRRIKFEDRNGNPAKHPTHANALILMGHEADLPRFQQVFAPHGRIYLPAGDDNGM